MTRISCDRNTPASAQFAPARAVCWYGILLVAFAAPGFADMQPFEPAGAVEIITNKGVLSLPAVSSDYKITVDGDIASVRLRQTFTNPHQEPVHARYVFPLNKGAAVHRMRIRVGNEVIEADIQEIVQAEKTFARAKREGKAAAIVRQHRPNLFTQRIANLMPGLPIEVDLAYVQNVPKVDGEYELVVPTIVGPRYEPGASSERPATAAAELPEPTSQPGDDTHQDRLTKNERARAGQTAWRFDPVPMQAPVIGLHLPKTVAPGQLSLTISLTAGAGQAIESVTSNTHQLQVDQPEPQQRLIQLSNRVELPNRDFVLRYLLGSAATTAGLLTHWHAQDDGGQGYFSLLIEPPLAANAATALPRELVFLLDCSGSMSGLPLAASKAFMRQALAALRPNDRFRIIRFSDVVTEFSHKPLIASPDNVAKGLAYTETLQGSGGTMMSSGIYQALAAQPTAGHVRQVVFLTDGYIGNEMEILQLVTEKLGRTRLYSFGVGTAVNRYLLDELARVGRGFTRYMDPTANVEEEANLLVARLQAPVLTDLHIDWRELPVTDVSPSALPDLFAGQSLRVQGRFTAPSAGQVTIVGLGPDGQKAQLEPWLELSSNAQRPALATTWARAQIRDAMHQFSAPQTLRTTGKDGLTWTDEGLQRHVTSLGLQHRLVTQWTAFVAVSKRIVNPNPVGTATANVPVVPVKGVAASAYPAAAPAFTGYGTPEPGALAGMLVMLLVALGCWTRRERILDFRGA